jgi:hypothetical protein
MSRVETKIFWRWLFVFVIFGFRHGFFFFGKVIGIHTDGAVGSLSLSVFTILCGYPLLDGGAIP